MRDVKEGETPPETGFGISYGMNTARQLSDIQRALQRQAGIAPRDEDITGYVDALLRDKNLSQMQKEQNIANAMSEFGVTPQRVQALTGFKTSLAPNQAYTPAYKPYQYTFAKKADKAEGGLATLRFQGGGTTSTYTPPPVYKSPSGISSGYVEPAPYDTSKLNKFASDFYSAPKSPYTPGAISSGYDSTKVGYYQEPTGENKIASTYAAPTAYAPGAIKSAYDSTKVGYYQEPTGENKIASTYVAPRDTYTAGAIKSAYDTTKVGYYKEPTGVDTIASTYVDPSALYGAGKITSGLLRLENTKNPLTHLAQ